METLPKELVLLIVDSLDFLSFVRLRLVSHFFREISLTESQLQRWTLEATQRQVDFVDVENEYHFVSSQEGAALMEQRQLEYDLTCWSTVLEKIQRKCCHCKKTFVLAENLLPCRTR